MSTSSIEPPRAMAQSVMVSSEAVTIGLADGRQIVVPLGWFPRLMSASTAERDNWRLIGHGEGIHWPELDEDISIENLLAGARSGERPASFTRWVGSRRV